MVVTAAYANELLQTYFSIVGKISPLPGETDHNFFVETSSGETYTFKISRANVSRANIDLEAAILSHLNASNFSFGLPEIIPASDGQHYIELACGQFLRLQRWLPGRMLGDVNPRSEELLYQWGKTCGELSKSLQNFDHPAAHRFYKWNPSETLHSRKFSTHFHRDQELETANYFWDLFKTTTQPKLGDLRKSVNYNDAHEHNLIVNESIENPNINGLIDFGDALYTHTINELAIACAYAGMHFPDPIYAMGHVVRGYHNEFPIEEKEFEVLYSLISARLLITVATAAHNKQLEPNNEYLIISEKPAWELLFKLKNIDLNFAHYSFRHACGFVPNPKNKLFNQWLLENNNFIVPPVVIPDDHYLQLDLSVGSLDLGNNTNYDTLIGFDKTMRRLLEDHDTDTAVGGYAEYRPIYTTDAYRVDGNQGLQWRTLHLGLDIWRPDQTTVFAPLDGIVHSVYNHDSDRNYGPTIILKHTISKVLTFYTLYGHLSIECMTTLKAGDQIIRGQKIAAIGDNYVNGGWPPHLHFQIMLDLLGNTNDFPGVGFAHERDLYLSNCPNPTKFFGLEPSNIETDFNNRIINTRDQHLGKGLSVSYKKPLHIVRGFKQYLYDAKGRRYLDMVNNVAHVGHEHPRVVRAAQRQQALLNTNTRYLHANITDFAQELLTTFPLELSVVYFVSSGSEANELALRMAEAYTDSKEMIAVEVGYHGNTSGCIGISSYKFDGKGGKGAPDHCHIVPIPDTFRGLYRTDDEAGKQYAQHVQKTIEQIHRAGNQLSGFICESILSCGGQIVLPPHYLKTAYQYVRNAGGLCIADEVQVGFGRVGEHFWGFQLQGVIPDIVTLGKPIGNGHPLAAVVTTRAVADAFANGMEYFNTFGGNPVSCAIGREVLQVIHDEKLQQHAQEMGGYLTTALNKLKREFPIIGDVRGHGLFIGVELIKNKQTREPAPKQTNYLVNRMCERGILMSIDGPFHNVLKIKPPMCISHADVDHLISNLRLVFAEDFMKPFN